ncbi:hypothetical protein CesoFtcFv8_009591 [Champsocephalus esox]|uniref:Uncharacterized protein n=2 Tax=Champsocephalus esox TaxID=159716 RepID=A0AAN8CAR3_9TELE|nr:hypothetical protein CesoFtcFv8_009591 [Champsocephalus esox]
MPGKCRFNNVWLLKDNYQLWLSKDTDPRRAKCKLCSKIIDISNMGEAALASHMKGTKHQTAVAAVASSAMFRTFMNVDATPSNATSVSTATKQTTLNVPSKHDVIKAEILWALKIMDSHYSYKSSEDTSRLFAAMFPDSEIAAQFACGESKCSYVCTYGLAPYFKRLILTDVSKQTAYVVLFDETMNHHLQSKQMDVHVRLWDGAEVKTNYIGSEFLGHSTAIDIIENMSKGLSETGVNNLIQLSMDGPHVNWKVFELLQKEMQKQADKSLLNIGSCGLHILHNAFRDGCKATSWDIEHILSSLYWLFHDCPARREDFVTATGCNTVMLKFCRVRWIENVTVSDRALKFWPYVTTYVELVNKGDLPDPKVKSFEAVKKSSKDPLFIPKVMIFNSIAREIKPFLTLYQTDKPMLPFFSEDLFQLMKGLMGRFFKEEPMKEATTVLKLLHMPLQDSRDATQINLGFSAETCLKQLRSINKVSERQALELRMECKTFLIKLLEKLQNKAPVNQQLVRSMRCLDPRYMAESKEVCLAQMKRILHHLVGANHVEESVCDDILREFSEFCDFAALQANFREFEPITDRVDTLLHSTMGANKAFSKVWHVVKMLLVLSHGQASVERRFSINKELIVENQKEASLVAQRLIVGHIRSVGGVTNVQLTKELLISVSGARQRYHSYLDDQKRANAKEKGVQKRKALADELDELKKRGPEYRTTLVHWRSRQTSMLTKQKPVVN